uniref:Uncharacterized protein n=1 Tax=Romanomermis culicivorax TaxID=13658 RepID=A0A915JL57_ROMCU
MKRLLVLETNKKPAMKNDLATGKLTSTNFLTSKVVCRPAAAAFVVGSSVKKGPPSLTKKSTGIGWQYVVKYKSYISRIIAGFSLCLFLIISLFSF